MIGAVDRRSDDLTEAEHQRLLRLIDDEDAEIEDEADDGDDREAEAAEDARASLARAPDVAGSAAATLVSSGR